MRAPFIVLVLAVTQLILCQAPEPQPQSGSEAKGWRPHETANDEAKKAQAADVFRQCEKLLAAGHLYHARELVLMLSSRYREQVDQAKVADLMTRVDSVIATAPQEGWRDTRWGMTKEQIKALYPQAVVAGDRVFVKVGFFNWTSNAAMSFTDGKLSQVNLESPRFDQKEIDEILRLLAEKYGPSTPTDKWVRRFETLRTTIDVTIFSDMLGMTYRSRELYTRQVEAALTKDRKLGDL